MDIASTGAESEDRFPDVDDAEIAFPDTDDESGQDTQAPDEEVENEPNANTDVGASHDCSASESMDFQGAEN